MKRFITLCMALTFSFGVTVLVTKTTPATPAPEPIAVYSVEPIAEPTIIPVIESEIVAEEETVVIEYPEATYIWNYLKDLGYNDYVCAGILGNIMCESGGRTLNIQPMVESEKYYGMCQWSKVYYPDIYGASLEVQCDYLRDTIKYEIDVFGKDGYDYESFIQIQDEQLAALIFDKSYERGAAGGYPNRQKCATMAYNYFTGLK